MNECDCGYSERKARNKEQWKPLGRDWSPPFPVNHFATCASLTEYPLRPLTDKPACEKCGQSEIRTTFHEAQWYYQPHHHDYWRQDLYVWVCALVHGYRPVEHLDRTCATCGFGWLERTANQA